MSNDLKKGLKEQRFRGGEPGNAQVLGPESACGFKGPQVIADVHCAINGRLGGKSNKRTGHTGLGGFLSFYSETVGKQLRSFVQDSSIIWYCNQIFLIVELKIGYKRGQVETGV